MADVPAHPIYPSRDATVTPSRDAVPSGCRLCGRPTPTGRARQWCSAACRQAAYRRRQPHPPAATRTPVPAPRSRRDGTVYTCPICDTRLLGEQRCPDCNTFAVRLGPGGPCPHCDEIVAITDLQEQPLD